MQNSVIVISCISYTCAYIRGLGLVHDIYRNCKEEGYQVISLIVEDLVVTIRIFDYLDSFFILFNLICNFFRSKENFYSNQ